MGHGSGYDFAAARAAIDEATNLHGLGQDCDRLTILTLTSQALAHVDPASAVSNGLGAAFLAARVLDTARLIAQLRSAEAASRADVGTALLAVEFVLRAAEYHQLRGQALDHCPSCGSPHIYRMDEAGDGGYRCAECGFTTAAG